MLPPKLGFHWLRLQIPGWWCVGDDPPRGHDQPCFTESVGAIPHCLEYKGPLHGRFNQHNFCHFWVPLLCERNRPNWTNGLPLWTLAVQLSPKPPRDNGKLDSILAMSGAPSMPRRACKHHHTLRSWRSGEILNLRLSVVDADVGMNLQFLGHYISHSVRVASQITKSKQLLVVLETTHVADGMHSPQSQVASPTTIFGPTKQGQHGDDHSPPRSWTGTSPTRCCKSAGCSAAQNGAPSQPPCSARFFMIGGSAWPSPLPEETGTFLSPRSTFPQSLLQDQMGPAARP